MNVGEHDRLIANLVMWGNIAALDEDAALVRVDCDGMLTDWIPWIELRAGPEETTWNPPGEGEQVIVLSPCGDPAQGVALGGIYQNKFPAPANKKTLRRRKYPDGTTVDYDIETHTMTVNAGSGSVIVNCAKAEVHATDSVLLDTPKTKTSGDLEVGGGITATKDITTKADVKAGDISLTKHHHTAQGATAPTTPSQA